MAALTASLATIAALVPAQDALAQRPATHRAPISPIVATVPAVISVTIIPVERAAKILRALYPRVSLRVDPASHSVIVVAAPETVQAMRTVIQGIDVRDPSQPVLEVDQLQHLKPQQVVPRLRALYPGAHIEAASKSSILIRANPLDMSQIKAVLGSLDTVTATPAPIAMPAEAIKISFVNPRDVARAISRQLPHLRASVAGTTIIVVGPPDEVERAKTLAQQIDQPAFGSKYTQVYRLHNVDATSVGDLIQRSYPNAHVTVDKELNALSVFATAAQHLRIAEGVNQLDASSAPAQNGAPGGGPAYGDSNVDVIDLDSAMPGQNGSNSTTATEIATAVTQLLGQMAPDLRIVPTNYSQILLAGSPTSIRLAKQLIQRLDRSQPLVVLDTEVLEVDENVARNIGLQIPQAILSTTFGEIQPTPDPNNFGAPSRLIRLQPLTRTPLQFTAVLNLLVQKGNARVLADPRITT
ncbi:MAG: hypothetical protein M3Y18_09870, partial [Candidatus Eremiobacteraeota bacterium]|nr:hypothetical protein [Candidatus Eremiobacteraeota bacterium]